MLSFDGFCGIVGRSMNWQSNIHGLAYGADYNPEQWPEAVWHDDFELMQQAGVNLVSLGIHAWAELEPEPGTFEFGWLDRAMDGLSEAGIDVDLATATATPPPWMAHRYPETLPITEDGTILWPGARQSYCPSSPVFRELSLRLVEQLAVRYASHPALTMWHASNEYGCHNARCYCDTSAAAFRVWLQRKYGTLDQLNEAWAAQVWGQRCATWDEILPPRVAPSYRNPTQVIDFRRFSSDELLDQFRAERDVLRRITPGIPVTTNLMVVQVFKELDYWSYAAEVDFIANDHYLWAEDPKAHTELAFSADLTRGLAGGAPWLLMEHSPSGVNWQPRGIAKQPGEMIRNSLTHVARGADGAMFFQWRQARAGAEKFHSGMVPHAGPDSKIFREVVELGGILRQIGEVKGSRIEAPVAMVYDWQSQWASEMESHPTVDLRYRDAGHAYHRALTAAGIAVDFVAPGAMLDDYSLVIVPTLYMVRESDAAVVNDYVAAGGNVLITYSSGIADENDHIWLGGYPGPFRDVLGVRAEELYPLRKNETVLIDDGTTGTVWTEHLHLAGATAVASYVDGPLPGVPAVTANKFGNGRSWYVATKLDDRGVAKLVDTIADEVGIAPSERPPADVEMVRRRNTDASYLFVINHSPDAVNLAASGVDLITGRSGAVSVAPGGVAVVKEGRS